MFDLKRLVFGNICIFRGCFGRVVTVTCRGKRGKGLGERGAKRHRKVLRNNVQGKTKPAIRSWVCRGGVKRISRLIYEEFGCIVKVLSEKYN